MTPVIKGFSGYFDIYNVKSNKQNTPFLVRACYIPQNNFERIKHFFYWYKSLLNTITGDVIPQYSMFLCYQINSNGHIRLKGEDQRRSGQKPKFYIFFIEGHPNLMIFKM